MVITHFQNNIIRKMVYIKGGFKLDVSINLYSIINTNKFLLSINISIKNII